jgi:hypothetical protein
MAASLPCVQAHLVQAGHEFPAELAVSMWWRDEGRGGWAVRGLTG